MGVKLRVPHTSRQFASGETCDTGTAAILSDGLWRGRQWGKACTRWGHWTLPVYGPYCYCEYTLASRTRPIKSTTIVRLILLSTRRQFSRVTKSGNWKKQAELKMKVCRLRPTVYFSEHEQRNLVVAAATSARSWTLVWNPSQPIADIEVMCLCGFDVYSVLHLFAYIYVCVWEYRNVRIL